jgi:hypothetical protein
MEPPQTPKYWSLKSFHIGECIHVLRRGHPPTTWRQKLLCSGRDGDEDGAHAEAWKCHSFQEPVWEGVEWKDLVWDE